MVTESPARELMDELSRQGILLEARGDKLRYWPKSAVPPETVERLREHKREIIARLQGRQSAMHEWSDEATAMIAWYREQRDRLPMVPFQLRPGCRVSDPESFYASLDDDIRRGPFDARATRGGLLADLRDLKSLTEAEN